MLLGSVGPSKRVYEVVKSIEPITNRPIKTVF
jgi:hypothetical protein